MAQWRVVSKALFLAACLLLGSLRAWALDSAYPKAVAKALARTSSSAGKRLLDLSAANPAEFERNAEHLGRLSGLTPEHLDSQRGTLRLDLTLKHWEDRGAALAAEPIDSVPLSPVHATDDARDAQILTHKIPAVSDAQTLEEIKKRLPTLEQHAHEAIGAATEVAGRLAQERRGNPAPPPKEQVFKLASNLRLLQVTPRPREEKIHRAVVGIVAGILEDTSIYAPRNIHVVKLAEYARDLGYRLANPAVGLATPSESYVFEKTDELVKAYLARVDQMTIDEKHKDTRRAKMRSLQERFDQARARNDGL